LKVKIEKVGERVFLSSPWYPAAPTEAKSIPGANWRKTEKVWSYPLTLQVCRDMRKVYGDRLEIGPNLTAWARAEVAKEKALHKLGRELDAELHRVPDLSARLAAAMESRTYQRSGAAFIRTAKRVLIADEPSMGKTAMALAGIMEAEAWFGSHLVVAPITSIESTWGRQIRAWTNADVFPMPEGKPKRQAMLRAFFESESSCKFLVVNPAMVRVVVKKYCKICDYWEGIGMPPNSHWEDGHKMESTVYQMDWPELFHHTWTSVTLDESHEALAAYTPANVTQTTEGLLRLRTQPDGPRIALTGTPLRGKERKIWGTLDWLGATRGGYWAWINTYFEVSDNGYGKDILGLREERKEDFYKMLDTTVLRRLKSEVRGDLPENLHIDHWVEMTAKQAKNYKELELAGEAEISGGLLSATGILAELTRLKQLAYGEWSVSFNEIDNSVDLQPSGSSPKVDMLLALLRERGVTGKAKDDWLPESGGHKYVVASQFTQVVDAVERALHKANIPTLKITGAITGARRTAAVKQFDESPDGPRVMLINTKAGGVSIDLDTYCDEMFILDETFVDDDQVQLRGRIDNRKGEVRLRTYHYIRTIGTIEQAIAENNIDQAAMTALLLDIRRGAKVNLRMLKVVS
jgi:SNF2 family DNA or RNA helicase